MAGLVAGAGCCCGGVFAGAALDSVVTFAGAGVDFGAGAFFSVAEACSAAAESEIAAAARLVAKVGAAAGAGFSDTAGVVGAGLAGLAGGVGAGELDDAAGLEGGAGTDEAGFETAGRYGGIEGDEAGVAGPEEIGALDLLGVVAEGVVVAGAVLAGGVGVEGAAADLSGTVDAGAGRDAATRAAAAATSAATVSAAFDFFGSGGADWVGAEGVGFAGGVAGALAGKEPLGAVDEVPVDFDSTAGTAGSGGSAAMREADGWSVAAGEVVAEAGFNEGVAAAWAGAEAAGADGGTPAGLTSGAGTEGSGGGGSMREVGGWLVVADDVVAAAGFAGGVASGGAGFVRTGGCSGGVARNVTASRCEAEGVRDWVTGGASRILAAAGATGPSGASEGFVTEAGLAGGALDAGVLVSAGFSSGCRRGTAGAGVICVVGTSVVTEVRWAISGRGGMTGGVEEAAS